MFKNSISVLWWRLVRAMGHAVYSLLWQGLLNCELLSTLAAGIYWREQFVFQHVWKPHNRRARTALWPTPCRLSLVVRVCGLKGGNAGSYRQAGRLMHDFQADLCMIFRQTHAWFSDWHAWFSGWIAWFSGRLVHGLQIDLCMVCRPTYVWFSGWLMHDFRANLCMIFRLTCMILRPTCAWFAGRLMHDFHTDLCMIFLLTYAWFSCWLMHDFQADLCMIFPADLCMIFPAGLCMIFRPTCAWFADWLKMIFPADLCMIFRPTYAWFFRLSYAWFSGWLMHDFPRLWG